MTTPIPTGQMITRRRLLQLGGVSALTLGVPGTVAGRMDAARKGPGAAEVAFQARRLKVAKDMPLAGALVKELEAFRVKVTVSRNAVYES